MKSPVEYLHRSNRGPSKVEGLSRKSLQVYDFLIFDCDGVILDSNSIKSEAFRYSLMGYPTDAIDELMEFHHQHGGISRYVKFEYFFSKILGNIAFEQELKNVLNHFQTYVFDRLIECPLVPGIEEILIYLSNQQKRCFVISGADEVELHQILSAHALIGYFETVFGSPATKTEIMRDLFKSTGMSPHNGLFFVFPSARAIVEYPNNVPISIMGPSNLHASFANFFNALNSTLLTVPPSKRRWFLPE